MPDKALDDAVFQRMKADHNQPPALLQRGHGLRQHLAQLIQFPVDKDPDRLEGARGRMLFFPFGRHSAADQIGELAGGRNLLPASLADDGPGDAPGRGFLAVLIDHIRDLFFRRAREPVRRRWPLAVVHAHIQRPVQTEAEAPPRVQQLRRGHAEVQQDAGRPARAVTRPQRLCQQCERTLNHVKTMVFSECLAQRLRGGRVFIKREQPASWPEPRQDRPAMSTAAKGPVYIKAGWPDIERRDHLRQQDRFMQQRQGIAASRAKCR